MYSFKSIKITDSGKAIILQRRDGSNVRYHSTWLRDNALDPKTRDANNGQRLITLSDIPINTYIESATLDESGKNIFLTFLPETKKVSFSASWLESHAYDTKQKNIKGELYIKSWRFQHKLSHIDFAFDVKLFEVKSNKNGIKSL